MKMVNPFPEAFAEGGSTKLTFFPGVPFDFLTPFTFDPTAGIEITVYPICITANGSNELNKVGTGSVTKAENRK